MLMPINDEIKVIDSDSIHLILEELAELLPSQGPIDVFIHHNTLHGLEHLSFFEAIETGAKIFDARSYLEENQYLEFYHENRIQSVDLDYILEKLEIDSKKFPIIKRILLNVPFAKTFQQIKWLLRESFLELPEDSETLAAAVSWIQSSKLQEEIKFLEKINRQSATGLRSLLQATISEGQRHEIIKEALWSRCLLAVVAENILPDQNVVEKNSLIIEKVNPFLIRFCEEYLDLGQATVAMPNRATGLLNSFYNLVKSSEIYLPDWLSSVSCSIEKYQSQKPEDILLEIITKKGLNSVEAKELIFSEVLALKGWAGFISSAEQNPHYLHHLAGEIKPSLMEFVTLRIILADLAEVFCRKELSLQREIVDRSTLNKFDHLYQLAYHLYLVVVDAREVKKSLTDSLYLDQILAQLNLVPQLKRQKIWHLAYEENIYRRALQAIQSCEPGDSSSPEIIAQMVFCLDDREESIRRHIEKQSSSIQTFGTAGFFGVDAIYQSISGEQAPFCPIVIKPTHIIRQKPKESSNQRLVNLQKRQQVNLHFNNYLSRFSGSIFHGWLMTIIGIFSLFPMLFSILFPRLRKPFSKFFDLDGMLTTELSDLEMVIPVTSEDPSEIAGYTELEMADRVANLLQTIGLTKEFGKLIIFYGHGSSSRNNPLKSAYDCGACGGRPGRMNARAIAMMVNRVGVRELLKNYHSIVLPEDTFCIGAYHNTCNDQVQYYDLDLLPESHIVFFAGIKELMNKACKSNSLERCRRFGQVSVQTPLAAYREVNSRSQTLAEPRPEYGHAGNALCFVGKRSETKNLFFDRRAFLVSYDFQEDPKAQILTNILKAIVPVCGGINLEYFFSALDNEVYGAGSKLPHNIVSMLGLMNGTCSDLRTGLPQQMIEIHEPVRLLMVVSCELSQLQEAILQDPTVTRMIHGQWIRLICWDQSQKLFFDYDSDGLFKVKSVEQIALPVTENYLTKIIKRSDNLDFLRIR